MNHYGTKLRDKLPRRTHSCSCTSACVVPGTFSQWEAITRDLFHPPCCYLGHVIASCWLLLDRSRVPSRHPCFLFADL